MPRSVHGQVWNFDEHRKITRELALVVDSETSFCGMTMMIILLTSQ